MADDESVSQFMAFTACQDTDTATSYLEMAGGNVEMAVGLFMEHGGGPSSSSTNNDASGTGDAAAAAAASGSSSPSPFVDLADDDVRAPDPTRRERLVDYSGSDSYLSSSLLHQAIHNDSFSGSSRRAFSWSDHPMDVDDDTNDTGGVGRARENVRDQINAAAAGTDGEDQTENGTANKKRSGPTSLSDMFAPPTEIMHTAGGFQGARNRAKDERKWLLVNLQNDSDFACHALNRDVWRNDLAEALITSSFIFWQAMNDTGDGQTYIQRYSVNAFPHVAIIDPRTGRLMWKKEGWTQVDPMTSEQFAQTAADFCSQHSFDKPPTASIPGGFRPNRPVKRPVEDLSEQEQLEKAIRESQGLGDMDMDDSDDDNDSYGKEDSIDIDSDNSNKDDVEVVPPPSAKLKSDSSAFKTPRPNDSDSTQPPPSPAKVKKEKTFEEIIAEMDIGEEPTEGALVQIRMPDRTKMVRKFKKEDSVKVIYAFVAQSNEEAKSGKSFEMKAGFPPKDLLDKIDETIESCNLSGESITVRWK